MILIDNRVQLCPIFFAIGVKEAVAGKRIGDISFAVQTKAESGGYSVVREWLDMELEENCMNNLKYRITVNREPDQKWKKDLLFASNQ